MIIMETFRVTFSFDEISIEVDAPNKDEAERLAADMFDFGDCEVIDTHISIVEETDEDCYDDYYDEDCYDYFDYYS